MNIKEFEPEYQIVNPHRSLLVSCNTTGIRSSYKSDYSGTLILIIDRNSAGAMGNGTPLQ